MSFNNKTVSREYAFKFLYKLFCEDFAAEKGEVAEDEKVLVAAVREFEESYLKEDEEHSDNLLNPTIQKSGFELISGYLAKEAQIVDTVSSFLEKRSYKNIGIIEKCILGLGVYEMNFLDTPPKVVINEYINLTKKYGNKESSSFINGILDKVNKSL